jgi:hypothetical protein
MPLFRSVPSALLGVAIVMAPDTPVNLVVDVSALSTIPARQFRAMTREVSAVWRPYGVSLTWSVSAATTIGAGTERPITVVREQMPDASRRTRMPRLGSVTFVSGSVLAEASVALLVEAIERLVEEAPWGNRRVVEWPSAVRDELVGRALGRVLAHEIGHYLLAWRAHTSEGLMRADFREDLLVDPDRRAFQISPAMIPRLNARLAQLRLRGSVLAETHAFELPGIQ